MTLKLKAFLLSGVILLFPYAAVAQTTQTQTDTLCSPNFNNSDSNEYSVENCTDITINHIYGNVYNNPSPQQNRPVPVTSNQQQTQVIPTQADENCLTISCRYGIDTTTER